jgi:carbohydrate kinase (thermoresistant glucokinase family)
MIIAIMGVAGCGKSTIGKILAERLSLPFIEADDFHSKGNVEKMRSGIPLSDEDRYPWLQSLSHELHSHEKTGAVLACSALKENYRQILQKGLSEKSPGYTLKELKQFYKRE